MYALVSLFNRRIFFNLSCFNVFYSRVNIWSKQPLFFPSPKNRVKVQTPGGLTENTAKIQEEMRW